MLLYQHTQPPKTTYMLAGKAINPQANSTLKFAEKRLPPINPETLRGIKNNLENAFNVDKSQIISDIKSDPILFIQCAKRIPSIVDNKSRGLDPLEALKNLEAEQLREMFAKPFPATRDHRIEKITKQQALSLKITIACAKYAEALATKIQLPSHCGFTNAVFQQIGLNLVAWNYPSLYSRVLSDHRTKGISINDEIEHVLGISPARMGHKLAEQWGVPLLSATTSAESSENLKKILNLSEICAQCEDPQNYPEAQRLLQTKEKELSSLLNAQEIHEIQVSIDQNLSCYANVSPTIASIAPHIFSTNHTTPLLIAQSTLQKNPFIARIGLELRGAFEEIYTKLEKARVSVDAIKIMTEKVVPLIGFNRGCLFLVSQASGVMQPALRFGDIPLSAYYSILNRTDRNIKDSVDMLTPMRKDYLGVSGESVSCIFSSLNHLRHEGVLYFEIAEEARDDENFNATLLFQAIRQSLKDCLDGV